MKKILIFLFILFTFTSSSFAANWYWLGATPDGTQWYVDNNDVIKTDMSAKVWTKIMRSNGKFSVTRVYVDRRNKMLAIISNTNYSANGVVLYQHVPTYLKFEPIIPDSMGDILYHAIWPY